MFRGLLSLFQKKSVQQITFKHPDLGDLNYMDGIWRGRVAWAGGLEIAVAGNETGPDNEQVDNLLAHLRRLKELEETVRGFLRTQLPSAPDMQVDDFQTESVNFLWPDQKDYFMVFLQARPDKYGLWKVEFVEGKPTFLSRDD